MSHDKPRPDRLQALQRWQSSELEEARAKMAQLNSIADDRQAAVERLQGDIANLHSLVRQQAHDAALLSVEALLRMSTFNGYQQQQLESARESHGQAAMQADDAQRSVLQLFEHLCVVQRLLDRRQELAGKERQRSLQKQLDEGALSRGPRAQHEITPSEDTTHGR